MPIQPHQQRQVAESFGIDPRRYDRTRPRYPDALIERLVAPEVLDVGIGTGIVARALRERGCRVLGVEPDPRMADFSRRDGFDVEVATVEQWDPRGRVFDAVVAGQTWHWVDPVAGAAKAGAVLREGGRLTLFWNAGQPSPEAAAAFKEVYERLMPESMMARAYGSSASAVQMYSSMLDTAEGGMREAGVFGEAERWRWDWEHVYSRDEWLDQVPAQGAHTTLPPDQLAALVAATGEAIDALGGSFVMSFATVAVTATRAR
ncbi:class I SAM-dependent methyltransferase [Paractinoplanes atraurantiacus]|uniref:Methyltransferase domain-containing protein n=1 Tax=Paractinoplanes atraurantiacus TaxID=1036182 RepID=A0A285INW8_9ACTN|nr:class I SAM-dependent methyltransferase [Actinoplanes atraurantiacus]SNY49699.1 Methyltransferase domain-containing protein [Actinoplanes atraurantiacus]